MSVKLDAVIAAINENRRVYGGDYDSDTASQSGNLSPGSQLRLHPPPPDPSSLFFPPKYHMNSSSEFDLEVGGRPAYSFLVHGLDSSEDPLLFLPETTLAQCRSACLLHSLCVSFAAESVQPRNGLPGPCSLGSPLDRLHYCCILKTGHGELSSNLPGDFDYYEKKRKT